MCAKKGWHRWLRWGALGLMSALLSACGGGGDTNSSVVSGTHLTQSIASRQTGLSYTLEIWLPPTYQTTNSAYRVVYAMDCEYRFATLTAVLQRTATDVILVNVCAMSSARRWVDFTMPGAAAYYRFLTLELIPFVEGSLRASPQARILSGHSLSAEFALYALYLENPAYRFFTSIISAECSCWYDANGNFSKQLAVPLGMEQAMYDASPVLPVRLVMAGDKFSNQAEVDLVYTRLLARQFTGLNAIQPVYNLGHVPMDGPAFQDALKFILANP